MTEYKKGDRVKVTLEGEYNKPSVVQGDHIVNIRGVLTRVTGSDAIEKLPDPLPTTPGSVIRRQLPGIPATIRFLARDGKWYTPLAIADENGRGAPTENLWDGYEVVFDAGAGK